MPTVVQFSNQFASAEGHGIARYSREVHAAVVADGRWRVLPAAAWSSRSTEDLAELKSATDLRLTGLGRRMTPLLWTYLGFPQLERLISGQVDVVHALSLGYPIATGKPYVVTVHDLGPLTHAEFFRNTRPWVMERSLRQAETEAVAIICVSRSTAQEVTDYLGSSVADRVHVIHEGVSDHFYDVPPNIDFSALRMPPDGTPFILSAGKISPRKNLQGLLRALALVKDRIPHHLVVVGGDGWDSKVVDRTLSAHSLQDRVHFNGFVSDEQLRTLYRRADLYAHPSLYEGFGLTVLEAMASGVPVLVSDRTSLPEVAGDAGRVVDPDDDEAVGAAIEEICCDPSLAADMSERGVRHAKTFTWERCAHELAGIYSMVSA